MGKFRCATSVALLSQSPQEAYLTSRPAGVAALGLAAQQGQEGDATTDTARKIMPPGDTSGPVTNRTLPGETAGRRQVDGEKTATAFDASRSPLSIGVAVDSAAASLGNIGYPWVLDDAETRSGDASTPSVSALRSPVTPIHVVSRQGLRAGRSVCGQGFVPRDNSLKMAAHRRVLWQAALRRAPALRAAVAVERCDLHSGQAGLQGTIGAGTERAVASVARRGTQNEKERRFNVRAESTSAPTLAPGHLIQKRAEAETTSTSRFGASTGHGDGQRHRCWATSGDASSNASPQRLLNAHAECPPTLYALADLLHRCVRTRPLMGFSPSPSTLLLRFVAALAASAAAATTAAAVSGTVMLVVMYGDLSRKHFASILGFLLSALIASALLWTATFEVGRERPEVPEASSGVHRASDALDWLQSILQISRERALCILQGE